MRKFIKQSLLDIIQTLYDAHNIIKQGASTEGIEHTISLLTDCSAAASQLKAVIEDSEGVDTPACTALEEYAQALSAAVMAVHNGENINRICKNITKKLINAHNIVREISIRWEVVFMPYKASMWDSLESVWKAADSDPACDAYVIPIPYYERKADGSLGSYCYEGSAFPSYVPIVSFETYSLKKSRPDVIYIHNPYDDENYVTSVAPCFYSSELKKWTDCLVYIPYFIHAEPKPEKFRPETISHFVLAPGVLNADKVILPSDLVRNRYIDITLQYMRGTGVSKRALEGKMLALGSPKYDRVATMQADGAVMPEAWREMVQRPNGSRKKIVFYNTGIGALLKNNARWINKIGDVFSVFKAHQDDILLLWRPHPLIEAALGSMRTELLEQYLQIKDHYIREAWGIYDDSVDVDRAVVVSDMFYGDGSSVARLFQSVAKPVKIQSFQIGAETEFSVLVKLLDAVSAPPPSMEEAGSAIHRAIMEERGR